MTCDQGIGGIQIGSWKTGQEMFGEGDGDKVEERGKDRRAVF